MVIGKGLTERFLTTDEVRQVVAEGAEALRTDGKRVLIIIPDGTRTMPIPQMFGLFQELLLPRTSAMDYLIALGTHQPMSDEQLTRHVGQRVVNGQVGRIRIFNHCWDDPASLTTLGTIPVSEIEAITGGLMSEEVPVRLNRLILDYDQIIICGPVFPHEVVGFSGGTKYFFPGIAAAEIINFTHWLGAVMTNYKIIGSGYTPVRQVIDRAAAMIDRPAACFALVVTYDGLAGLYFGSPHEAWEAASALSAQKHIVYVEKPYRRVLSVMPRLYDDLWTAGKGMYKMEPAVADGGEVVIYAPHIDEVSYTHGKLIDEIGYHCRDYFLAQWDRFKRYPGGILAHSTHVKGLGTYDAATGTETPRIRVSLATGIPEERCRRINLGYIDPASIDVKEWQDRESDGILAVPRAGEMLYRLKGAPGPASPEPLKQVHSSV
jgi:nickel-dependent lactate racemase